MRETWKEYQKFASFFPLSLYQQFKIFVLKEADITDYFPNYWVKKKEYQKMLDNPKQTMEDTKQKIDESLNNIKNNIDDLKNTIKSVIDGLINTIKNIIDYRYFWLIAIAFFAILILKKR